MDLQTIRSRVRELINVPSGSDLITDGEILAWANMWQRDMAAYLEWPIIAAKATSVTGQRTYTLPSDFMQLQEVHFKVDGGDYKRLPVIPQKELVNWFGKEWLSDANGAPQVAYFADNAVIGFHYVPNSANNGTDFIQIFYIGIPTAMSADTDTPDLHESLHDVSVYFISSLAFLKMKMHDQHNNMLKVYLEKRAQLKNPVTKFARELRGWRWGEDPNA